jgi:CrcB protein
MTVGFHAAVICLGACLGALARWRLSVWLNTAHPWVPLGTLAANLVGGLVVGVAMAAVEAHPDIDPAWRLAVVTGFLGALTTFSTFSAETVALLQMGRPGSALALSALHLLGSLAMTWLGLVAARAVF